MFCFFVDFSITQLYSSLSFIKIYSKNHCILCFRKAFISMCFYPERLSIHFCSPERVDDGYLLYFILFHINKCGHRNVLSIRQVWMSIFHIINFKKKWTQGSWIFLIKDLSWIIIFA